MTQQDLNHVGDIVFFLGVIVSQLSQMVKQCPVAEGIKAGIDFADGFFFLCAVLELHNFFQAAVGPAHDAAVGARLLQGDRQDGHIGIAQGIIEPVQGFRLQAWGIPVDDQGQPVFFGQLSGLHDGMSGAQLGFLQGKLTLPGQGLFNQRMTEAGNGYDTVCAGLFQHLDNDFGHGHAADFMQDFRHIRVHAGSLPGGQDNCVFHIMNSSTRYYNGL